MEHQTNNLQMVPMEEPEIDFLQTPDRKLNLDQAMSLIYRNVTGQTGSRLPDFDPESRIKWQPITERILKDHDIVRKD